LDTATEKHFMVREAAMDHFVNKIKYSTPITLSNLGSTYSQEELRLTLTKTKPKQLSKLAHRVDSCHTIGLGGSP